VTVKRALGILIRDGTSYPDDGLYFNNDFYYTNGSTAYIALLNGIFTISSMVLGDSLK
jgi:hypothetical protein